MLLLSDVGLMICFGLGKATILVLGLKCGLGFGFIQYVITSLEVYIHITLPPVGIMVVVSTTLVANTDTWFCNWTLNIVLDSPNFEYQ